MTKGNKRGVELKFNVFIFSDVIESGQIVSSCL